MAQDLFNTLQHTATHCNTLQHADVPYTMGIKQQKQMGDQALPLFNTLQHTATYYNTLQHTATHCNTLQHTATHCNTLQHADVSHTMGLKRQKQMGDQAQRLFCTL